MLIKRTRVLIVLMVIFVFALFSSAVSGASSYPAEVDEWLQKYELGPYQVDPAEIDDMDEYYEEIYQAAIKGGENQVVIYAGTSRVPKVKDEFEAKYPGIELVIHNLDTSPAIQKITTEQVAQRYECDVLTAMEPMLQKMILHANNMIFPWVPPDLKDVIPERYQEPLLIKRLAFMSVAYNSHFYDAPPISNIWELTTEEWKGQTITVDPRNDVERLVYYVNIVLEADSMAEAYKDYFGKEIELTTPNAGYEWIRDIFNNDIIFNASGHDISDIMGSPDLENPPISIAQSSSNYRFTGDPSRGNPDFRPILDINPIAAAGPLLDCPLSIAYNAPHPNAAKLLVRFLLGDEKGGSGFAPWFVLGNWPSRVDIKEGPIHPQGMTDLEEMLWPLEKLNLTYPDGGTLYGLYDEVLRFITDELG